MGAGGVLGAAQGHARADSTERGVGRNGRGKWQAPSRTTGATAKIRNGGSGMRPKPQTSTGDEVQDLDQRFHVELLGCQREVG